MDESKLRITVDHGKWNDPRVWEGGTLPKEGDVCIIEHFLIFDTLYRLKIIILDEGKLIPLGGSGSMVECCIKIKEGVKKSPLDARIDKLSEAIKHIKPGPERDTINPWVDVVKEVDDLGGVEPSKFVFDRSSVHYKVMSSVVEDLSRDMKLWDEIDKS
jgi:hypothetical protein